MRRKILPEDYRGIYKEKVLAGDLIVCDLAAPEDLIRDAVAEMDLNEGLYDSLWRLSLETELGLVVDIRRFPLSQSEIARCDREDIDPYKKKREGRLLLLRPLSEYHLRDDVNIIGYMTEDPVCRIKNKDRESFLKS